eukprot:TRINITY_DN68708_c0_g1_i1.p1 TRINITY_DN68708_c0_g1~~TRINITY_DN68708_c0_g1_i1.p1  ORF type:complete len:236 (-),score=20.01 TRINITY_DN68708_c0_g1_i1:552-1259(-)
MARRAVPSRPQGLSMHGIYRRAHGTERPNLSKRSTKRADEDYFRSLGGIAPKKTFHSFAHHLKRTQAVKTRRAAAVEAERATGRVAAGKTSFVTSAKRTKQADAATSRRGQMKEARERGLTLATPLGCVDGGTLNLNASAVSAAGLGGMGHDGGDDGLGAGSNKKATSKTGRATEKKASGGTPAPLDRVGFSAASALDGVGTGRGGARKTVANRAARKLAKNQRARRQHRSKQRR